MMHCCRFNNPTVCKVASEDWTIWTLTLSNVDMMTKLVKTNNRRARTIWLNHFTVMQPLKPRIIKKEERDDIITEQSFPGLYSGS